MTRANEKKKQFCHIQPSFEQGDHCHPSNCVSFIQINQIHFNPPACAFYSTHSHFWLCNHHHIALIPYSPLWWPFCCCVIMSLVMWFGCMPSCHWSSAPQNNDDDIWLFVRWGPLKPVNCAPQSLSILLLFNSTSERLHACWIGGRCSDLNYSSGQIARYLFFGNVGNQ